MTNKSNVEWQTDPRHMIDNGTLAVTIFDNVLDEENWPVDCIVVVAGVITEQFPVYKSDHCAYKIPSFKGRSTVQLGKFLRENDGNEGHHPCVNNAIAILKSYDQEV